MDLRVVWRPTSGGIGKLTSSFGRTVINELPEMNRGPSEKFPEKAAEEFPEECFARLFER